MKCFFLHQLFYIWKVSQATYNKRAKKMPRIGSSFNLCEVGSLDASVAREHRRMMADAWLF